MDASTTPGGTVSTTTTVVRSNECRRRTMDSLATCVGSGTQTAVVVSSRLALHETLVVP